MRKIELTTTEVRNLVQVAEERITSGEKLKIVVWDPSSRKLRVSSALAGHAAKSLVKPTCLGQYDYEVRTQDLLDDFLDVLAKVGTKVVEPGAGSAIVGEKAQFKAAPAAPCDR